MMGMSENSCPTKMTAASASCVLHSRPGAPLSDGSAASAVEGVDGGLVKLRTLGNRSTGVVFGMVQSETKLSVRLSRM